MYIMYLSTIVEIIYEGKAYPTKPAFEILFYNIGI